MNYIDTYHSIDWCYKMKGEEEPPQPALLLECDTTQDEIVLSALVSCMNQDITHDTTNVTNQVDDVIDEEQIYVGDVYKIGSALVQITQPREPCATFGAKIGDQSILKNLIKINIEFYKIPCKHLQKKSQ